MAAALTLKDICCFNEKYPDLKGPICDPKQDPVQHFNVVLRPLFGLVELSGKTDLHSVVDLLRTFLRKATRTKRWHAFRVHKFLWSMRCVKKFLVTAVHARRQRLWQALDKWEAHDLQAIQEHRQQEEAALARYCQGFEAVERE